jgi:DNA-binding response OmpR family regulator
MVELEARMRSPKVLVVEADPGVRALIGDVLCAEGYQVQLLGPDRLSMSAIAAAQPDLLVLELLPSNAMRTLAFIKELHHQPATAGLPILVSTTLPLVLEHHRAALCGFGCTTMLKPFDVDDLLGRVGQRITAQV